MFEAIHPECHDGESCGGRKRLKKADLHSEVQERRNPRLFAERFFIRK